MTQRIAISVTSKDKRLEWGLIEPDGSRMATGMSNEISEDAEIEYRGTKIKKAYDFSLVPHFVLTIFLLYQLR